MYRFKCHNRTNYNDNKISCPPPSLVDKKIYAETENSYKIKSVPKQSKKMRCSYLINNSRKKTYTIN